MKAHSRYGFTLIEVMLFLAVTGALTIGILIGSSASINQQRYRDSVNSVKGYFQHQYSEVINVNNSDTDNPVCSREDGEVSLSTDGGSSQPRGTSDCLMLGRYLLVKPEEILSYDVIGLAKSGLDDYSRPLPIEDYDFILTESDTKAVDWGAKIVKPRSTDGMTTSLLIVRSPLSGSVITYIKEENSDVVDGNDVNISGLLNSSNTAQKDFCIDSQGSANVPYRRAVRVTANASSQSAVEIPVEGENACD